MESIDRKLRYVTDGYEKDAAEHPIDELLKRQNPFAARDVGKPRLVWNPEIHHFYDDTCSFFLLKYRYSPKDALDELHRILDQHACRSHYIYWLFGNFDVLIRVWASPARMNDFRNAIRQQVMPQLFEAKEFQVDQNGCRLLLSDSQAAATCDRNAIQDRVPDINQVAQLTCNGAAVFDPEARKAIYRLVKDCMIHFIGADSEGCFRFFTVIHVEPGAPSQLSLKPLEQLMRGFKDPHDPSRRPLVRAAIYKGFGHGNFLIAGIFTRYNDLTAFSQHVRNQIDALGVTVRTETYLTASSYAIECDFIDPMHYDLAPETRMVQFVTNASPGTLEFQLHKSKVSQLPPNVRQSLRDCFDRDESELVKGPFAPFFREFLAAQILNESRRLAITLTTALEIEGLICRLWTRVWVARSLHDVFFSFALASNLFRRERNGPPTAEEKISIDQALKKPTLGQALYLIGKYKSEFGEDLLAGQLGDKWADKLESLREIRNDMAHGRVLVEPDYLQANWNKIAAIVHHLGELYNKLKDVEVTSASQNSQKG